MKEGEYDRVVEYAESAKEINISGSNTLLNSVKTRNTWKNFNLWHATLKKSLNSAQRMIRITNLTNPRLSEIERYN